MINKVECEYKYLMSEEKFNAIWECLKHRYDIGKINTHINYYYDTKDNLLNTRNITVRVRQIRNNLKFQIKCHNVDRTSFVLSDEYVGTLEKFPLIIRIPSIKEELSLKGILLTERKELFFGKGSKIYFDTSTYLGKSDYEIEIEYCADDKDLAEVIAADICRESDFVMSKSKRFFERWEEINREENVFTVR